MYRTLYAKYVLGWSIEKFDTAGGRQVWVFAHFQTPNDPTGSEFELSVEDDGSEFPVWNDELIAIFEKEVKK